MFWQVVPSLQWYITCCKRDGHMLHVKRDFKRCWFEAHMKFRPKWVREQAAQRESIVLDGFSTRMPRTVCVPHEIWASHLWNCIPTSLTRSYNLTLFFSRLSSLKLNDPSQGIWQAFVTQKNNFQQVNLLKLYYDILVWSFCWLFLSQVLHVGQTWWYICYVTQLASNLLQFSCGSLLNPGIIGTHYQIWLHYKNLF